MSAEDIVQRILETTQETCKNKIVEIFKNWVDIGFPDNILEDYGEQMFSHISNLLDDMKAESEQRKKSIIENIKSLLQKLYDMHRELGTSFANDNSSDTPLIQLELNLKEQEVELERVKEKRLNYIKELVEKEINICKKIGSKPKGFDENIISEKNINNFDSYVKDLQETQNRYEEMFEQYRCSIEEMMLELGISPSLNFEKLVIEDPNNFVFSTSNINKLKELKAKLEDQIEEAKEAFKEKRQILVSLWSCIEVPEGDRKKFLAKYNDYSLQTLNAFQLEIDRCKSIRNQNISIYIMHLREEISKLWDLCKYDDKQKRTFAGFRCDTFNEDLLKLHDLEVERLRRYYDSNRKIFELLHEWESQFEKLKELDKRANDPDRYHNRGGQLLAEEKERKSVEKKLPKLASQLNDLAYAYEIQNKKEFLVNGMILTDYMNHVRDSYETEKENNKMARKQAKDKSMKKTPLSTSKRTPGATSMMRLTPASQNRLGVTASSTTLHKITPAAKRKLPYENVSNGSEIKKRAVTSEKTKPKVVVNSKVRRSGKVKKALNGSSRSNKSRESSGKKQKVKNDATLSASYMQFEEHIDKRIELRSSVKPGEVTPMRTPRIPVRRKDKRFAREFRVKEAAKEIQIVISNESLDSLSDSDMEKSYSNFKSFVNSRSSLTPDSLLCRNMLVQSMGDIDNNINTLNSSYLSRSNPELTRHKTSVKDSYRKLLVDSAIEI